MAETQILEGTRDELEEWLRTFPKEQRFRLSLLPLAAERKTFRRPSDRNANQEERNETPRQLLGLGKFAGILPNSEEFMRQKQEEIDLEEGKFRK